MADVKVNLVRSGFSEVSTAIEGINKKLSRMIQSVQRVTVMQSRLAATQKKSTAVSKIRQEKSVTTVADREARRREQISRREANRAIREAKRVEAARNKASRGRGGRGGGGIGAGIGPAIGVAAVAMAARRAAAVGITEGKRAINMQESAKTFKVAGRRPGQEGVSESEVLSKAFAAGKNWGFSGEDVMGGASGVLAGTGDVQFALNSMDVIAKVGRATGSDLEELGEVASALYTQMDVKTPEELLNALAILTQQAKNGAVELKDLAGVLPKAAAAAKVFGLKGDEGISMTGGLMQMSRGQFGSPEEAATSVNAMFRSLDKNAKLIKDQYGVDMKDENLSFSERVGRLMASTGGDSAEIMKLLGEGYKTTAPLSVRAREMKAGGATPEEIRDEMVKMLGSFTSTMNAIGEIERDAAEQAATASAQWESKMTEMREELAKIDFMPIIGAIAILAPALVELAKIIRDVADFYMKITGQEDKAKVRKSDERLKKIDEEEEKAREDIISSVPEAERDRLRAMQSSDLADVDLLDPEKSKKLKDIVKKQQSEIKYRKTEIKPLAEKQELKDKVTAASPFVGKFGEITGVGEAVSLSFLAVKKGLQGVPDATKKLTSAFSSINSSLNDFGKNLRRVGDESTE